MRLGKTDGGARARRICAGDSSPWRFSRAGGPGRAEIGDESSEELHHLVVIHLNASLPVLSARRGGLRPTKHAGLQRLAHPSNLGCMTKCSPSPWLAASRPA